MVTTIWALKHVLFLIDYNKLSRCMVKENKLPVGLYYPTTPQSVKKNLLLRFNYHENVGKESKNTQ